MIIIKKKKPSRRQTIFRILPYIKWLKHYGYVDRQDIYKVVNLSWIYLADLSETHSWTDRSTNPRQITAYRKRSADSSTIYQVNWHIHNLNGLLYFISHHRDWSGNLYCINENLFANRNSWRSSRIDIVHFPILINVLFHKISYLFCIPSQILSHILQICILQLYQIFKLNITLWAAYIGQVFPSWQQCVTDVQYYERMSQSF